MKIVTHRDIRGMESRILNAAGQAALVWGHTVAAAASNTAPILSGDLRRAITVDGPVREGNSIKVRVGTDSTVDSYAAKQEFDTSMGFGPISQAAGATRPWLRPAFESSKNIGVALVRQAMNATIKAGA